MVPSRINRFPSTLSVIFVGLITLLVAQVVPAKELVYQELASDAGRTLRYALLLPDHFDPTQTYPTLLALPPGGQDETMVEAGLNRYWGRQATARGWVVVSPVAPEGVLFFQGSEKLIPALLDEIQQRVHIEGGKFHLTGASNGGLSAFRIALKWPSRFQSLVVLPGFPPDKQDFARLDRLAEIPVRMFAGGADTRWAEQERRTKKQLDALGVDAALKVFPGEGHIPASIAGDRLMELFAGFRP